MKLKTAILAGAASLAVAAGASAQDYEGLYGSIQAGLNYVAPDRDFESEDFLNFDSEIDYNNGIGIVSALGYDWGNSWRTELEFGYRQNDARHIAPFGPTFNGFPDATLDGELQTYSLMTNVLYDLDKFADMAEVPLPVSPYVGGGVGGAVVDIDIDGNNPVVSAQDFDPLSLNDDELAFAYQGIAGLAIGLAEGLSLDLNYRYFGTFKRNYQGRLNGVLTDIKTTPNSHMLMAGLRWNFGAPAAAPAPAPVVQYKDCWDGSSVPVTASCPPQIRDEVVETPDPIQVTVYFDYDKSNLTPEASSLIREAVARSRDFDVDGVRVVGNTDTSGSSAYNQALSERRARVVRDALIAQGIGASMISIEGRGENSLAKSTPDGVREPLNRRSEITIMFE